MMIQEYNLFPEYIGVLFTLLFLFFMLYTRPRKTTIYIMDFLGIVITLTSTITRLLLYRMYFHYESYSVSAFNIICTLLFLQYNILLNLIFRYVSMLSLENRLQRFTTISIQIIFSIVYAVTFLYFLLTGKMFNISDNGIQLTEHFNLCPIFGILCCILCFVVNLINRKHTAKTMYWYVMLFAPVECILLTIQIVNPKTIFSSITYLLPFAIFYMLFHSNPYDEITGCQNRFSYETRFMDNIKFHRNFMIIYVVFPRMWQVDESYNTHTTELFANICRQIDSLKFGIDIYRLNSYNYTIFITLKKHTDSDKIIDRVTEILNKNYQLHYKMVAFKNHKYINSVQKLFLIQDYLISRLNKITENKCYVASEKDYEDFNETYKIEKLLSDIKNKNDLNDEHVICYAQPIYSVKDNCFKTAEALVRLQLDGKIIYPDKFISVAEGNGSIHTLTCIMLNKICRQIKNLSLEYDFDAITINCSTIEMNDTNLYREILTIIKDNDIPYSKIRLELTESAMCESYDNVIYNIDKLREAGVLFYLDDFGTGYSNLERIITCPFQTIKFDKSLLYKAMKDKGMDDLMASMINVFKKQGFVLLVEGVEDDIQSNYSIEKGFNYIQGYKYAKPIPIENLHEFFEKK